jgi:hypothetical protein
MDLKEQALRQIVSALEGGEESPQECAQVIQRIALADLHDVTEIADVAVETFSRLHPQIRMNLNEWLDLKECIEREVRRRDGELETGAAALLSGNRRKPRFLPGRIFTAGTECGPSEWRSSRHQPSAARCAAVRCLQSKSRKTAALFRIPFLADLILYRQAGGGRRAALRMFLIGRLRLGDPLNEVVDGGLIAHMAFLRARCIFRHNVDPPERL